MWRKLIYPHSLIVTCLVLILIWVLNIVRINAHFLNPFDNTIRDYEITDIVYAKLRDEKIILDDRIVLVNTGKPDRDTMRMVIDRIIDAGAKVVAVDILLEGRKNFRTDSLLRATLIRTDNDQSDSTKTGFWSQLRANLKRRDKVVLAMELDGYSDKEGVFQMQTGCDTFFCNYVNSGFVNFISRDSSSTIRYFSPREMTVDGYRLSFATQTAKLYDPPAVERLLNRNNIVEEIFYTNNGDQFTQYETKDILDTSANLTPLLQGKIVMVGFLGTYAWDMPMLDRHYTPLNKRYTGRNSPDMYGMVIHANILQMILNGTYIKELSVWERLLLTFIFCYLNIHLFYEIFRRVPVSYHFVTRFLQLGEIILLFFVVALLFRSYRIKMDVAYWIAALALAFDVIKFYDNTIRKRFPLLSKIPYTFSRSPGKIKSVQETSPKSEVDSPKPSVRSPKSEVDSPKPSVTSPKSEVDSPKPSVTSPKSKVDSPKTSVTSPKSEVDSPKPSVRSPKSKVDSPKSNVRSRKPAVKKPVESGTPITKESPPGDEKE